MLQLTAANCGWSYERLSDLARVLRIPGTQNVKEPANPKAVAVYSFDKDRRYNLSDFEEFLDAAGILMRKRRKRLRASGGTSSRTTRS